MMKNTIITFCLLFSSLFLVAVYGQQDAQYTQYMYNTMSVNPAYAGSRGVSIAAFHRSQWVGLEGAPKTQTLNLHTPIGIAEKVGLGFSVIHDNVGPLKETYFDVDFSYKIQIIGRFMFSFWLEGGRTFVGCCIFGVESIQSWRCFAAE